MACVIGGEDVGQAEERQDTLEVLSSPAGGG
jgi:hypothetical protein